MVGPGRLPVHRKCLECHRLSEDCEVTGDGGHAWALAMASIHPVFSDKLYFWGWGQGTAKVAVNV